MTELNNSSKFTEKVHQFISSWKNEKKSTSVNADQVKEIFENMNSDLLHLLESSSYLELYLWPFYIPESSSNSKELILSILSIVNERARLQLALWGKYFVFDSFFDHFFNSFL